MSEEMDYNITPITHNCTNAAINKPETQINTPAHSANLKLDNSANQAQENSRYDTISETDVESMYGGKKIINNMYKIFYKKKTFSIQIDSEKKALRNFIKNINLTQDELIQVQSNKENNMYILRNTKKIKYIKVNI